MSTSKNRPSNEWAHRIDSGLHRMSDHILQHFPACNGSYMDQIAALHLYVYEKVEYESRNFETSPRSLRMPRECWRRGGNCQEQIMLLASLLKTIPEVEMRTKGLTDNEQNRIGHRILEVRIPAGPDTFKSYLKDFYDRTQHFEGEPSKMSWSIVKNKDDSWIVADPEFSSFLGDLSEHRKQGYVVDSDGSWTWHQVDTEDPV